MTGRSQARRWQARALAACLAATALTVVGTAWPAGARPARFDVQAAADGVRFGVLAPGATVVDQIIDVGVPVAQAVRSSLGGSQAFAALPYPGDTVVNGPATVAALMGAPAPPPYPLIAQSSHPGTPSSSVSLPSYELKAASDATSATSSASVGGNSGDTRLVGARATASAVQQGDAFVAEATAAGAFVSSGSVLRVVDFVARAKVAVDRDGRTTSDSDFRVDGVFVAGTRVGVGASGLTIAGTDLSLPDGSAPAEALRGAGITVSYLQPVRSADGVVSAGLRVTERREVNGTTYTFTYTLGQARARAAVAGDEPVATNPPSSPSTATVGAALDAGVATGPAPAPVPSDHAGFGATPVAAMAPTIASPGRAGVALARRTAPLPSRSTTYVVLVIAAAIALIVTQLFRVRGVRLLWRS